MTEQLIEQYRQRANQALEQRLPDSRINPQRLHQAMRYASINGGKRIRPVLVFAAGAAVGVDLDRLEGPAVAVELIHSYSLIHDDLPAMDDDDLRRGQPTCHKAFDDATAILAGDALQALAFQVLTQDDSTTADAEVRLKQVTALAQAAGSRGMVGGQAIDLAAVGQRLNLAELENMHIHKTGALIRASVLLGALSQPQSSDRTLASLDHYAKCVGLAFQIRDDVLDVTADTQTLGKSAGADQAHDKPTYAALLGVKGAREHARDLSRNALEALSDFGSEADALRWIAEFIVERKS